MNRVVRPLRGPVFVAPLFLSFAPRFAISASIFPATCFVLFVPRSVLGSFEREMLDVMTLLSPLFADFGSR